MGRKHNEQNSTLYNRLILLLVCFVSCGLVYFFLSAVLTSTGTSSVSNFGSSLALDGDGGGGAAAENGGGACCRGIENLELWGAAVKWGSEFKFNSSEGCCNACKSMCTGNDGPCLCDTWVFCGNREACGSKFGECWLKKQKDSLAPEQQDGVPPGEVVSWTSGLIFGKGEGIIGLETEYGTLHIKLFPDCAPHSVAYILELLKLRHCAGCQFYRAESRGQSWDSEGNHIKNEFFPLPIVAYCDLVGDLDVLFLAAFGPPYALIQGTLEAQGTAFNKLPMEDCPTIRRGSVVWIGTGPEFFISLANHAEWKHEYTVFGSVLPEDMHIAERIATLPTTSDVWNNVNVTVLEKPVPLLPRRIKKSHED